MAEPIRFVIFASYGNDSVALIQWAHEWKLEGVTGRLFGHRVGCCRLAGSCRENGSVG